MSSLCLVEKLIDKYDLVKEDFKLINNKLLVIEKWNWEYEYAHLTQLFCVDYIRDDDEQIVLIYCSHPNSFTMGRGLQKLKNDSLISLVEFNQCQRESLSMPVYDIKRGGGLTFHHPGQFVFYPILKTTKYHFKVYDLMIEILSITATVLNKTFEMSNLKINKDLLGLWVKESGPGSEYKIASIGLAASSFVTYHGLALNVFKNNVMNNELSKVYPCGLSGDTYKSVNEIINIDHTSFDLFKTNFQNSIYEMIDRHKSSVPINSLISETSKDRNFSDNNLNIDLSLS